MYSTKICTFNLEEPVFSQISNKVSNIYNGKIGKRINIPNSLRGDVHHCLLDIDYPNNFHEYEIFIIDLMRGEPIEYDGKKHRRRHTIGSTALVLESTYPENLFDPIPLCLHLLRNEIDSLRKKSLFIVFADSNYEIEYQPVAIVSNSYPQKRQKETYSLYNFFNFPIPDKSKSGVETKVNESVNSELATILKKHNESASYFQTFYHPQIWDDDKQEHISIPRFLPLMFNSQDEIISYVHFFEDLSLFVFPQIKEKSDFLDEFLFEFTPNFLPDFFPEIIKKQWTKNKEYFLPNHADLLRKKEEETLRHNKEIQKIENQISTNYNKYSFLHEMLINTGDDLVKSVIVFLKWIGFEKPVDLDVNKEGVFEEDIQIETDKGLIIIEVKGIGGTSKDADCSQITKIKYRRSKERESFDVFAHYLVNHQRHLPPLNRTNPPFSENQISDALNEERGLMSTWQLYNLYFLIQSGIITKEEAREKFYRYGLIDFKPDCQFLGKVNEIFQNGYVVILNIENTKISVGDTLLVEKNNKMKLTEIVSLQINDSSVQEAKNTEVGVKLNSKIANKSLLYLK